MDITLVIQIALRLVEMDLKSCSACVAAKPNANYQFGLCDSAVNRGAFLNCRSRATTQYSLPSVQAVEVVSVSDDMEARSPAVLVLTKLKGVFVDDAMVGQ